MFESCVIPASLEHEFIFAELPALSFEAYNFQPHSASPASQINIQSCARVSLFTRGADTKISACADPRAMSTTTTTCVGA